MTGRGWWCLLVFVIMLLVGIFRFDAGLVLTGLTLLLWFGWEWLFFSVRVRWLIPRLRLERQVGDERGPVTTLWQGRDYAVRLLLHLTRPRGRFPHVAVADCVPFAVQHEEGSTIAD